MTDPIVSPAPVSLRTELVRWFARLPGHSVLQSERALLAEYLPGLFGYHIVQLGQLDPDGLIQSSRIGHKVIVEIDADRDTDHATGLLCLAEALPLEADSVDVLVLPHVLEFESHPHQVLRECERVLIGEGHVVLLTFNPWSLWGLVRLLLAWRETPPWNGHFFSAARLQDWLKLLDFEIIATRKMFYRPPFSREGLLDYLGFMEKLGRLCWPWFGAVHVIVAKKRIVPLTPVREIWRHRRRMIASGYAEPSAHRDGV